jgi:hypothetical protein
LRTCGRQELALLVPIQGQKEEGKNARSEQKDNDYARERDDPPVQKEAHRIDVETSRKRKKQETKRRTTSGGEEDKKKRRRRESEDKPRRSCCS